MLHDALIVGGSFAGLSAAMQLARARRSVCVVDAGAPRNRFAAASHGFFGQDGAPPLAMIAQARERLLAYPSVRFVSDQAVDAALDGAGGFVVSLEAGEPISASRLVLAFGVHDMLPEIAGLRERWGASVLHCPYCHGYEFGGRQLGVLYRGPLSLHQAQLIAEWGPTTLFLDGEEVPDDAESAALHARGIAIEPGRVLALEGGATPRSLAGVRVVDGRLVPLDALYIVPRTRMSSPLAEQLGCAFDDGPFGPVIRTDALKQTTVAGVHAAGDAAQFMQNATLASADGVLAGVSLHRSLVFDQR
jgi:thioredoxin reductase